MLRRSTFLWLALLLIECGGDSNADADSSGEVCNPGGAACESYTDCCSGTCTNQTCAACGQQGDACEGECCRGLSCIKGTCLTCRPNGERCEKAADCCSNSCSQGSCGCTESGAACTSDTECCGGNDVRCVRDRWYRDGRATDPICGSIDPPICSVSGAPAYADNECGLISSTCSDGRARQIQCVIPGAQGSPIPSGTLECSCLLDGSATGNFSKNTNDIGGAAGGTSTYYCEQNKEPFAVECGFQSAP